MKVEYANVNGNLHYIFKPLRINNLPENLEYHSKWSYLKLAGLDSILAANNQTTAAWFWFIIESREVKYAWEKSPAPIYC
jgi:hypothetical protein